MVQFPPTFMINGTIFDFDIVNFPFLDGDVPRRTSYGIYISQLVFVGFLSSRCLGRAAVGDCGTPWTFLLPVFLLHFLCFFMEKQEK